MKRLKLTNRHSESGFTLLEMLVVMTIVGVIVGFGAPALNSAKEDAFEAKRDALVKTIETAKIRYSIKYDVKPSGLDAGTPIPGAFANFAEFSPFVSVNGGIPDINDIIDKANNKCGKYIDSWGTYPAADGTVNPVTFSDSAPVDALQ
jgi:prepilin-type N-terminal cleavage/methylation domain-containing protein